MVLVYLHTIITEVFCVQNLAAVGAHDSYHPMMGFEASVLPATVNADSNIKHHFIELGGVCLINISWKNRGFTVL